MDETIPLTLTLLRVHVTRARTALRTLTARSHARGVEAGVSTLEMVIIALGLMAVAGLLVAAITAAVTRRTNQIQ